jgi:hypothetical protein
MDEVCVLAQIVVVPVEVTVLLGLCHPPHQGINSWPNLGRNDECTPLCGFLVVVHFDWVMKQSRLCIGCYRNPR